LLNKEKNNKLAVIDSKKGFKNPRVSINPPISEDRSIHKNLIDFRNKLRGGKNALDKKPNVPVKVKLRDNESKLDQKSKNDNSAHISNPPETVGLK
jgi:hypothetical protein